MPGRPSPKATRRRKKRRKKPTPGKKPKPGKKPQPDKTPTPVKPTPGKKPTPCEFCNLEKCKELQCRICGLKRCVVQIITPNPCLTCNAKCTLPDGAPCGTCSGYGQVSDGGDHLHVKNGSKCNGFKGHTLAEETPRYQTDTLRMNFRTNDTTPPAKSSRRRMAGAEDAFPKMRNRPDAATKFEQYWARLTSQAA